MSNGIKVDDSTRNITQVGAKQSSMIIKINELCGLLGRQSSFRHGL